MTSPDRIDTVTPEMIEAAKFALRYQESGAYENEITYFTAIYLAMSRASKKEAPDE